MAQLFLHRRGDVMYAWWFSPQLVLFLTIVLFLVFSCRGDYTGEEIKIYSRSPLSEPEYFMSGRIHRELLLLYSRSPLSEPVYCVWFFSIFGFQMTGRKHRRGEKYNSRSPLYETETVNFDHNFKPPNFDHFLWAPILNAFSHHGRYAVVGCQIWPPIYMYI